MIGSKAEIGSKVGVMLLPRTIREILAKSTVGEAVVVHGWVRTMRETKERSFIEVADGSCVSSLQVVAEMSMPEYDTTVRPLTTGSSLRVDGMLVESPAPGQKFEVQARRVIPYCIASSDYPLQKKRHSFEFLRQIAHLRPRTNALGAVARVRSSLSLAVHTFFCERGFFYVHTPLITTSDCEGAGKQFTVSALDMNKPPLTSSGAVDFSKDFFGKQARLTVSGQLEGEAYALSLGRIYTFGPTFRAENSNTARHLAEFWMIEPEVAFADLECIADLAEEFVQYLIRWALEHNSDELQLFNQRIDPELLATLHRIESSSFKRISYTDAIAALEKVNNRFEYKAHWGCDIQSEHERYLVEELFRSPVIVYDYPSQIKAFYMRLNDDRRTVRAMDLLVPRIGELIGGSQREEREDVLRSRMKEHGLDEKAYAWYLDLRRFGGAPHAGFGLGFERLLQMVTGMQNIREVIPFPRFPGNAEF